MLDAGIHLRKSLCCKEIDYRFKPDNDNFRSFSVASEVEGYTIVVCPLKYEAKQKVKSGQLDSSDIPMNDEKNRFGYHVGVTARIDDELYVIDPFYNEHSPGLSKQEDWINSQYGAYSEFQKKDSKYSHLESFELFRNKRTGFLPDTVTTYNYSVNWLNEQ